jgi:hypothetical protein
MKMFIGTNLLIVAKVHKLLFYTLLCRNLYKNGKSPQFSEIWNFPKSIPAAKISKMPRFQHEDDVKRKHIQHESCWIFFADWYKIRPKWGSFATARPWSLNGTKHFQDSKSWWRDWLKLFLYEINSAKKRLEDLWAFVGVTINVLEVPKSPLIQGIRSDGPSKVSNTIYWPKTLFFGGTTKIYEFAS